MSFADYLFGCAIASPLSNNDARNDWLLRDILISGDGYILVQRLLRFLYSKSIFEPLCVNLDF
ncbi:MULTISPECIES: hypothetical protein [unclassified Anabaena]|uniref:hypothetical protein n=1 Tax=unclassified Anabaena TaxID=2619674 RepID=UPI000A8A95F6|nr:MULTISPECIES: hypothetical protein [unclassified Anabaena]